MKKTSFCILILVILFVSACSTNDKSTKNYLEKVLRNLDQVESATYYKTSEAWVPGDTIASGVYHHYIKEYNNPLDTTIGVSFVSLQQEDTTKFSFCYDGHMRATVYENENTLVIDSFTVRKLPFRPVSPPFFNFTKSIIRYALETDDSISMDLTDYGDSVYFKLAIFAVKQVEFFGKAYYMDDPFRIDDEVSRYEIWINSLTGLPYRVRREMSHDISVVTCRNVEINKTNIKDFNPLEYFGADLSIQSYRIGNNVEKKDLIGKQAWGWILKDVNNNIISFNELKSQVLMIQFTSVSCGPCRASVPFLKQLSLDYNKEDFDFVAIESFNQNLNVLKNYQNRIDFDYKFLLSTKEVTKNYQINSVPVFFILDKNRVIRKVINGYGVGTTDKEIRDILNELI
jgi:thiol-disulfide isomerase/thioredoxin